jgi:regulation of enolase protein 1 (concanavalin A-like superfamily)
VKRSETRERDLVDAAEAPARLAPVQKNKAKKQGVFLSYPQENSFYINFKYFNTFSSSAAL